MSTATTTARTHHSGRDATSAPTAPSPSARRRDADGAAVAAFIIGLLGTVIFNVVFGPLAAVLGTVALARRTRRRGRAALGILLGTADVVLLAVLVAGHHDITWTPGF